MPAQRMDLRPARRFPGRYRLVAGALSSTPEKAEQSAAAVGACAAGMGSKEVMATAPIMVLSVHRLLAAPTLRAALTACLCTESVLGRAPLPQAGNLAESAGVGLRISQHHPYN